MKLTLATSGALTALAAALAFTAVPASARPDDSGQWHGRHDNGDNSGQHRGWEAREQRAPAPQAAPQAQAQAQVRQERFSQWRQQQQAQPSQLQQQQRRDWGQARQDRNVTPQAREVQQADGRSDRRGRDWQGQTQQGETWSQRIQRNGTYSDPNRNTTYRDAQRSDSYRDRRDGYRDGNRQGYRNDRQWDRNWRNNNRYDWQRYRQYNRNAYHLGRYYSPYRNYSYRRLNIGFYLDPLFFSQDYWIGDPGYYRLPDVYGPYRWVRYYDDALLVDVYSGEVVDVIYDFFW